MMRQVMIVDDESLVRIGLQTLIEWENCRCQISAVCKNGEEALQAASAAHFDIVFTDIRMPGMDGFELIEKLKRIQPHLHFVILTSYQEFEYARQALRLGVKDYISKYELEPEQIIEVLSELDRTGESTAKSKPDGVSGQDEKLSFLAMTSRTDREAARHAASMAEQAWFGQITEWGDALYWLSMKSDLRQIPLNDAEQKAMSLLAQDIFAGLKHVLFLGWDKGILHGLIGFDSTMGGSAVDAQMKDITAEIQAAYAGNLNIQLVIGISSPERRQDGIDFTRMHGSAERCLAWSFFQGPGVYRENDDRRLRVFEEQEWLELYQFAKQKIGFHQFHELQIWLETCLTERNENRILPSEWQRFVHSVANMLIDYAIERLTPRSGKLEGRFSELRAYANRIEQMDGSRADVLDTIRGMIETVRTLIADWHGGQHWIHTVKQYVEAHYREQIRLEEVARLVHFSENYFSQRFRQETGQSFSDYVTEVRIGHAVMLYRETDLSTEEIAYRVGYANPNYFVKVFKKVTGSTVSDFKKI